MTHTVAHPPFKEGSRYHVLSYHGGIIRQRRVAWVRCSEPNCEINAIARQDAESADRSTFPKKDEAPA